MEFRKSSRRASRLTRQRDGQSTRARCGLNIAIGDRTLINYDDLLHGCNPITIGDEVKIATRVTATDPLETKARRTAN